jgi:hypothetical protein
MQYTYVTTACPNCRRTLFFKITGIMWFIRVTSGLGPNFVICSYCNTRMMTTNKEWPQMSAMEKTWYVILSIVYGLVLGFMTSIVVALAVEKLFRRTFTLEEAWLWVIPPIVLVVFGIQMLRILLSIERMEDKQENGKTISFWNWETNLQFYGMMWILLVVLGLIPFLYFF